MDKKVYDEGYMAFLHGKANPYRSASREAAWFALGYCQARSDHQPKKKGKKNAST